MERRRDAAQATLDRFKDKPFEFGTSDCARLVAFHLRQIGKPVKVAKAGSYKSLLGATRALKRLGFDNLSDLMDSHLERLPAPAFAIAGDVIAMPGEEGPGALSVCMGNGRALGFHADAAGAVIMEPREMLAAWRTI